MFIAGVPIGVFPGVSSGVEDPIWLAGVSSHRDFLLLAPGVGVSSTDSSPLSVRGVSAQPLPCPGVSRSVLGVSSQRFLRTLPVAPPCPGVAWPGVSLPGVAAPAGVWLGVGSHMRVLGVAPGVSLPFGRPGVSSHRLFTGVCAGVWPGVYREPKTMWNVWIHYNRHHCGRWLTSAVESAWSQLDIFLGVALEGVWSAVWSQRRFRFGTAWEDAEPLTALRSPDLAFSARCRRISLFTQKCKIR